MKWWLKKAGTSLIKSFPGRIRGLIFDDAIFTPSPPLLVASQGCGCACFNVKVIVVQTTAFTDTNSNKMCAYELASFFSQDCEGSIISVEMAISYIDSASLPYFADVGSLESFTLVIPLTDTGGWTTLVSGVHCKVVVWVKKETGLRCEVPCACTNTVAALDASFGPDQTYMPWTPGFDMGTAACTPGTLSQWYFGNAGPDASVCCTTPYDTLHPQHTTGDFIGQARDASGTIGGSIDEFFFQANWVMQPADTNTDATFTVKFSITDVYTGVPPTSTGIIGIRVYLENDPSVFGPGTGGGSATLVVHSKTETAPGEWTFTLQVKKVGNYRIAACAQYSAVDCYMRKASTPFYVAPGAPNYMEPADLGFGGTNLGHYPLISGSPILNKKQILDRRIADPGSNIHVPPGASPPYDKNVHHFEIAAPLGITIFDANDNICTNMAPAVITLSVSGSMVISVTIIGPTTATTSNGTAYFPGLRLKGLSPSFHVNFDTPGLSTLSFLADLDYLGFFIEVPSTVKAGVPFTVKVGIGDYDEELMHPSPPDEIFIFNGSVSGSFSASGTSVLPVAGVATFVGSFPAPGLFNLGTDASYVTYNGYFRDSPLIEVTA